MLTYYNEFDPKAAAWINQLQINGQISLGTVDKRSICDVQATECSEFVRRHYFAGIGGWDYALRLAGWPKDRPVTTASCPCQPFSNAGKKKAKKDERHLWPEFFRIVQELRPETIFGEQVSSGEVIGNQLEASFVTAVYRGDNRKANRIAERIASKLGDEPQFTELDLRWFDGICTDLEGAGYSVWAAIIGAHSVGSPHIRQRLYWVANLSKNGRRQGNSHFGRCDSRIREEGCGCRPSDDGCVERLGVSNIAGSFSWRSPTATARQGDSTDSASGRIDGLVDTASVGYGGRGEDSGGQSAEVLGAGRNSCPAPSTVGVPHPDSAGSQGLRGSVCGESRQRQGDAFQASDFRVWDRDWRIIECRDGKKRRTQSSIFPLAYGLPKGMVYSCDPSESNYSNETQEARVMRLRGYGNAIVPQVAAAFIRAFMESE